MNRMELPEEEKLETVMADMRARELEAILEKKQVVEDLKGLLGARLRKIGLRYFSILEDIQQGEIITSDRAQVDAKFQILGRQFSQLLTMKEITEDALANFEEEISKVEKKYELPTVVGLN